MRSAGRAGRDRPGRAYQRACAKFELFKSTAAISKSMTSAEPARTSAYSADIAIRVVWQRMGMGMTFRDIAKRLQKVGLGSAHRLYRHFTETRDFKKAERSSRRHTRKLDEFHELHIIGLLMENPGLYLDEIKLKIKEATRVTVSGSTICRAL